MGRRELSLRQRRAGAAPRLGRKDSWTDAPRSGSRDSERSGRCRIARSTGVVGVAAVAEGTPGMRYALQHFAFAVFLLCLSDVQTEHYSIPFPGIKVRIWKRRASTMETNENDVSPAAARICVLRAETERRIPRHACYGDCSFEHQGTVRALRVTGNPACPIRRLIHLALPADSRLRASRPNRPRPSWRSWGNPSINW